VELFLLLMDEVAMLLAGYVFFDKGMAVCLHDWPEVADAEDSGGLYPFSEVVDDYYKEFYLTFPRGKGAEDVHSPFCEGPWGEYEVELFLLLMDEVAMLLAGYVFFDKGMAVYLHGWPEVAGTEDSGGHGACAGVMSAYAFVQFFYYVLGLFDCDAFKEWLAVSTLL